MVATEAPPSRRDNVKYQEARHPYLSNPTDRPKFLMGAATNSFEVNDVYSSKIELSNNRDHLYLSGEKGLTKVKVNKDNLSTVYTLKKGKSG